MFDREKKVGFKVKVNEDHLAEIRRGSSTDPVIDFVDEKINPTRWLTWKSY